MASDDFEVIAYKILAYLYKCMKGGKKVDVAALRQLTGCNESYFADVVRGLQVSLKRGKLGVTPSVQIKRRTYLPGKGKRPIRTVNW